jgi:hypothetical protein
MESVSIAIITSIITVIITILTFSKNSVLNVKNDSKENGIFSAKLDYISQGIYDIKLDNKARDKEIQELVKDLIELKQNLISTNKRLDLLENK